MFSNILTPGAVLIVWTLIMLYWMFFTRMAGFKRRGMQVSKFAAGGRGSDLDGVLEPKTMWKAHNYIHLMEQPTVFYPAIIILHMAGGATQIAIYLAWGYVAFRIAHSIWQATVNKVSVRLPLFICGTACLSILSVLAVLATCNLGG